MRTTTSATTGDQRGERGPTPVLFVVDDDLPTMHLLCEVARERGWQARGFTRLETLGRALDEQTPTLLVLDDELPDGRGGDLARELRHDGSTASIPLLVYTAAHPGRQAQIGAWAPVIAKPFGLDEIEQILDAAAGRPDGGSSLGAAG